MTEIGRRVEGARRSRMWTQARLAREAGVSPTTVSGIETGKIGRPHFGTLTKLAQALRVAPEELLDSLSRELDAEQERLQRLYGEFPEASQQGRFIKRQIREVAGQSGSVKTSAMVRRNQDDAKRTDKHPRDTESSNQSRNLDQRDKHP